MQIGKAKTFLPGFQFHDTFTILTEMKVTTPYRQKDKKVQNYERIMKKGSSLVPLSKNVLVFAHRRKPNKNFVDPLNRQIHFAISFSFLLTNTMLTFKPNSESSICDWMSFTSSATTTSRTVNKETRLKTKSQLLSAINSTSATDSR